MALSYDSGGALIQRYSFAYARCADQNAAAPVRHPIAKKAQSGQLTSV